MNGLSIILPVYNEAESFKDTLRSLEDVKEKAGFACELIIVDDGSDDQTGGFINDVVPGATTKVLRHRKNKGYGAALKTGVKAAKYGLVFIVDCDSTYPISRIPEFAGYVLSGICDMAVGARRGKDAHIPFVRRPAKWCIQRLACYLTGENIPDINSGFRCIKKEMVEKYMNILPDGFSFTTTITLAMMTNGYQVEYRDISYQLRKGTSKIRPLRDTYNFIQLIIKTVLYFEPLKIFLPMAIWLALAGAFIFGFGIFVTKKMYDITTVIMLMAAFQIFAIGLIADMIARRGK